MIPLVYDQVNAWGKDDEFFLALLKKSDVKAIADLGCGTGRLTTHFAAANYEVTAIDPNAEAIGVAKGKASSGAVKWIVGDSADLPANAFDAVIMTANVAQVFLTEESWEAVVADAYRALKPGGHFIFDTRNPLAKVWEEWEKDTTPDLAENPETGEPLEIWTTYDGMADNVFTFYETVKNANTGDIVVREKMELKFRTREAIRDSLEQANFSQVHVYGDWEFEEAEQEAHSFIFHGVK